MNIKKKSKVAASKRIQAAVTNDYDFTDRVKFGKNRYRVLYTGVNTESSAKEMFDDFRFQISVSNPYDDADYAWCYGDKGVIKIIKGQKVIHKAFYFNADDMDVENTEWCDEVVHIALSELEKINGRIAQRIIHNSRKISADATVEDDEDEIKTVDQEYDSANTSINSTKLPAIYNMVNFPRGAVVLDYGGGKFDNAVAYLDSIGCKGYVYDPYNRSAEHNRDVIKTIRANGGADITLCSNVLNVIKEPEARQNVLENIRKLTKPSGKVYITVYEGKGDGAEGPTKSGYQLNRKTAGYLDEVKEVFPEASRKGKLICASYRVSPKHIKSSRDATFQDDRRLSTSERYRGYLITLDRSGDGYNVYDKHRELEDSGYPSRDAAKKFIDSLIMESDQSISSASRVSAADKDAVVEFAKDCKELGYPVEDYTAFSEILRDQGMVPDKTLYQIYVDAYNNEDDIEASVAVDNTEREFQRIDRSGTDEEVQLAAVMYNLGATLEEAREILPTLSEDKIQEYVDYYNLRHLPRSERLKIWDKRKVTSATDSEYALFKKTYSHSREFKDKDKQSGSIRDLIDELENKGISYEIYDNKTDNGCTIFYDDDGTVTAASYGGAFDIEDDQYFTEDELVEFGNTVCDYLNETFNDTYDVSDVYMDTPKRLVLTVVQESDESEFTAAIDLDMRKIKKPSDLMARYTGDAVYTLQQDIKAYKVAFYSSATISSSRYWYFTRHGVQPGSVPKYVNILDIVDTPEGSYFLADGVILTNDLRDYEIKERKPEDSVTSSTHVKTEGNSQYTDEDLQKIAEDIEAVVVTVMKDEGFDDDEAKMYSRVTISGIDDSGLYIEVGAEVDYELLERICSECNKVIQALPGVDEDSYFEPIEPGIAGCYIIRK